MTSFLDSAVGPTYPRSMTSDLDTGGETPTELRRRRFFRIQMRVAAALFLLANLALYEWGDPNGSSSWRLLWAVVPLIPVSWIVIAIVFRVRQLDEYQIKLFFPGLAVGFTVSMVTAVAEATLGSAGLDMRNGGWAVLIAGMVAWEVTNRATEAPSA